MHWSDHAINRGKRAAGPAPLHRPVPHAVRAV